MKCFQLCFYYYKSIFTNIYIYIYTQNKHDLNIILKSDNNIEYNVQKQIENDLKKVFPFAQVIFIIFRNEYCFIIY